MNVITIQGVNNVFWMMSSSKFNRSVEAANCRCCKLGLVRFQMGLIFLLATTCNKTTQKYPIKLNRKKQEKIHLKKSRSIYPD